MYVDSADRCRCLLCVCDCRFRALEGRNGIARGANPWSTCKPDIQALEGRQGCCRVGKRCDMCHPPGFSLPVGTYYLGGWHPRLLHSTLPAFRPVPARRVEMAIEKKASLSAKKSASGLGVGPPSSSRPGSSRPGDIHFFLHGCIASPRRRSSSSTLPKGG